MCLTPTHLSSRIAEKDILCKKRLIKRSNRLYTPYQNTFIEFNKGICIQKAYSFGFDQFGDIHEGIHSDVKFRMVLPNDLVYPCIIPKGTQYYVGDCDDLVSLKLIIFKNKFRCWIYKIFHK